MPAKKNKTASKASPVKNQKKPETQPVPMPVTVKRYDLTDQLGYRAIYNPEDLDNSTLFPAQRHFLGGNDDGNKIIRFVLLDPALAFSKKISAQKWQSCKRTAERAPRGCIKPLENVRLTDPGTKQNEPAWEFRTLDDAIRLLGAWIEVEEAEEEAKYHILVFNTPVGKVGNRTAIPHSKTFKRALRFPRISRLFSENISAFSAAQDLPKPSPAAAAACSERVQDTPKQADLLSNPATKKRLAEIADTKKEVEKKWEAQAASIHSLSAQLAAQNISLAAERLEQHILLIEKTEAELVQHVFHFVHAMEDFLRTPPEAISDPEKAAKYVGIVIGSMSKASTSAYIRMIHKTETLPAPIAAYVEKYIEQHPVLWQLRNHFALSLELKHFLDYGETSALEKHYAAEKKQETASPAEEKEAFSWEEIASYFSSMEAVIHNKEAERIPEVETGMRAIHTFLATPKENLPQKANAGEGEESPEEDNTNIEAAVYLSEIPEEESPAIKHAVLEALQAQETQIQNLSSQLEAQAEQRAKYDLAAQHIEKTQKNIRKSLLFFVHSMKKFLDTEEKTKWAANAAAGLVGEVIEAIQKGSAAYHALLQEKASSPVATYIPISSEDAVFASTSEITKPGGILRGDSLFPPLNSIGYTARPPNTPRDFLRDNALTKSSTFKYERYIAEYVKTHPEIWQLESPLHLLFTNTLVDDLYAGELALLKPTAEKEKAEEEEKRAEEKSACAVFQLPLTSPYFARKEEEIAHITRALKMYHGSVLTSDTKGLAEKQIAAEYAERASKGTLYAEDTGEEALPYQAVIWLRAGQAGKNTPLECIGMQYIALAESWCELKKPNVQEAIAAVYHYLQDKRSLIVFEGAESHAAILPYLPPVPINPYHKRMHCRILMTSPHTDWGSLPPLSLGGYQAEKASVFVQAHLPESTTKEVEILTSALSHSYLALSCAVSYIVAEKCDIQTYLAQFSNAQTNTQDEQDPILAAFLISLERIKQTYPIVVSILDRCAYFAATDIPLAWLETGYQEEEGEIDDASMQEKTRAAIAALQRYGILQPSEKTEHVDIDPYLQDLLRQQITEADAQTQAMECVMTSFGEKGQGISHAILPHLDSITAYYDPAIFKEESALQHTFILETVATYYLMQLAQPQKACVLYQLALDIAEKEMRLSETDLCPHFTRLGTAYYYAKKYDAALLYLKKAYVIHSEKTVIDMDEEEKEMAITILTKLADTYGALEKWSEKKRYLEEALPIQEMLNSLHMDSILIELVRVNSTLAEAAYAQNDRPQYVLYMNAAFSFDQRGIDIQTEKYDEDDVARVPFIICSGRLRALAHNRENAPKKAVDILENLLRLQKEYYPSNHPEIPVTLIQLAHSHGLLGNDTKKRDLLADALAIQEAYYGADHYETAATLLQLGNAYGELEDFTQKRILLERALFIQEAHFGDRDHYEIAATLVDLGNVYSDLGEHRKGLAFLEQALQLQTIHFGTKNHPSIALTFLGLSNVHGRLENMPKKQLFSFLALGIQEKHFPANDLILAPTLFSLGNAYEGLGKQEEAWNTLLRAATIQENHYDPYHYKLVDTFVCMAHLSRPMWLPKYAKTVLEKSLAAQEKHYGPKHEKVSHTLVALSKVYGLLSQLCNDRLLLIDAQNALNRALAIQEQRYGIDHHKIVPALIGLQNVHSANKNFALQCNTAKRALDIQENYFGQNHPKTAFVLTLLAVSYYNLKQHKKALALGKRSYRILMQDAPYGPKHMATKRCIELLENCGFTVENLQGGATVQRAQAGIASPHTAPQALFHHKEPVQKLASEEVKKEGKKKHKKKKKPVQAISHA